MQISLHVMPRWKALSFRRAAQKLPLDGWKKRWNLRCEPRSRFAQCYQRGISNPPLGFLQKRSKEPATRRLCRKNIKEGEGGRVHVTTMTTPTSSHDEHDHYIRGIPYMMSASGKHIRGVINTPKLSNNSKYISWSEGGEVENPQNCEDVIHGCPLATH